MVLPRLPLLYLVLTAVAPAQDRREPVRGSAELPGGAPWPGATVHLLSRPVPLDERIGEADEVSVLTDDKGRFSVSLLVGRTYLAWAIEALAGNDYRASFPVEDVISGRPLALVADEARPRRELEIQGIEAWNARGDLVLRVISDTTPRHVAASPLKAKNLLPPMPSRSGRIEITCGGLPLLPWPMEIDLRVASGEPWQLRVPREARIRVTDTAGRPVQGAELSLRAIDAPLGARETTHELGLTDLKGDVVVTLPAPADGKISWVNYGLGIHARGYEPVGNIERFEIPADHDASTGRPVMTLPLKPGNTHAVLLTRGDQPYAGQVALRADAATIGQGMVTFGDGFRLLAPIAGQATVYRMPSRKALLAAPTSGLRRPPGLNAPLHPLALLGVIEEGDAAAPRWDLDALQPRMFSITRSGTPDSSARLAILVESNFRPMRALTGIATDRAGRVAVLMPPDISVTAVAFTGDAYAVAKSPAVSEQPVALELQGVPSLSGSVVGKDGEPVALATVEIYLSPGAGLVPGTAADRKTAAAVAAAIQLLRVATARDGTFHVPLFPGTSCSVRGVATPQGSHYLDARWTVGVDTPNELALDLRQER